MSKARKPTVDPVLSAHMAKIGRSGGRASTAAKAAAAGRNAGKPYRNGQVRGWPKGKPRAACSCNVVPHWISIRRIWVCGDCLQPAPVRKSHARKAQ